MQTIGSISSNIYAQAPRTEFSEIKKPTSDDSQPIGDGFARSEQTSSTDDLNKLRSAMLNQSASVETAEVSQISVNAADELVASATDTALSVAGSMVPGPAGAGLASIRILFTNDIHGAVLPTEDKNNPSILKGGLSNLSSVMKEKQAEAPSITLDGGDWFQGTYIGGMDKGETVMKILNEMNYDATIVGNHDFDYGLDNLHHLVDTATFPVLGGNIIENASGKVMSGVKPYIMKEVNGVKVGIIGVAEDKTATDTNAENTVGLHFENSANTINKYKKELEKQGAQMVIVVSHNGPEVDARLAQQLQGVDVIVSAHSHQVINPPRVVGDTLLVQSGSKGMNLGQLDLVYDPKTDKVVSYTSASNPITNQNSSKDPAVEGVLAPIMPEVNKKMGEVVGETTVTLTRRGRYPETIMGDIVTDSMRHATGADVAFTNSGGIRDEIRPGKITYGDVFKVIPFDNGIVTMDLTGEQLKGVMEESAKRSRGTIEVSGMKMDIDPRKPKGQRCSNIMVNGQPLDLKKTYRVATADFLAGGSNGYTDLTQGKNVKDEHIVIREGLNDYIKQHGPFTEANARVEGRQNYLAPMPQQNNHRGN